MLINSELLLDDILAKFRTLDEFAVDTETSGVRPYHGDRIVGISLYHPSLGGWYASFRHGAGYNLPESRIADFKFLSDPKYMAQYHNGKFDIIFLNKEGIEFPRVLKDSMLAAHLLNENTYFRDKDGKLVPGPKGVPKTTFTLEHLSKLYLGYADTKESMDGILREQFPQVSAKERKGHMWKLDSAIVAPYAAGDTELTWKLCKFFEPHLRKWRIYDLWLEVGTYSRVIAQMEARGLKLDVSRIHEYIKEAESMIAPAKAKVDELAGYPINLQSSKQVQAFLGVPHADHEVLEQLRESGNPAASAILEYRGWAKMNNTYYKPYLELMDGDDALHPNFSMIGTITGRLSAFDPNLQAVPRETSTYKVKDVFVARPGYALVEGDLSQAEIRTTVHYGKEAGMKRILEEGRDMHSAVAEELHMPRDAAKRLNFSVIFGVGAKTLSERLHIPLPQATEYLSKYHKAYPGFKRLYNAADREAKNKGYIRYFTGRLRHFDQFNESHRASSNLSQGSVAEIIRLIILWMDKEFPDIKFLATIHDSVLFECKPEEVDEICALTGRYVGSMGPFYIPQKMDFKVGPSWGEMQKWEEKANALYGRQVQAV